MDNELKKNIETFRDPMERMQPFKAAFTPISI